MEGAAASDAGESKRPASNIARLHQYWGDVDEQTQATLESSEVELDWHGGPAPAAVRMPDNPPVEHKAEIFARLQPMPPWTMKRGDVEAKPLTGVDGWPSAKDEEEESEDSKDSEESEEEEQE